jgi:spermidine synthase
VGTNARTTPVETLSPSCSRAGQDAGVAAGFEEIDRRVTAMGEISLRRRLHPALLVDIYEVKLDDDHLMSSLFTEAEEQLARLALGAIDGTSLDVVVGGLGLGYTARAVLEDPRVRSLHVVEALEAVIDWHTEAKVPVAADLNADPRCGLVHGDFFRMVEDGVGFGPGTPPRPHVVLVDIDHTPRHVLHPSHAAFYTPSGLAGLAELLAPGGVFALWSDDPPDDAFLADLATAFVASTAHVVAFPNPLTGERAANTIYVATRS